jgi:hypothetical protein
VKAKLKKKKNKRSTRPTNVDRRLIETLAAFANLKREGVADFRGGVQKSRKRNRWATVSNFLPEVCWKLPAPSPSPGSPPLPEGLLGWKEIQQLVRTLWDSIPPFPSYKSAHTIVDRLRLYSMIATLPDEELEKLRFSTLDPSPPLPPVDSDEFLPFIRNLSSKHRAQYDLNLGGSPREPRSDEYEWLAANVSRQWSDTPWYAERLKAEGKMPSLEQARAIKESICPCEEAVVFMTSNRWRAKTCRNCLTRYIALEQQSKYCSHKCSGEGRRTSARKSGNGWWHNHGKEQRRERQKKEREEREKHRALMKSA